MNDQLENSDEECPFGGIDEAVDLRGEQLLSSEKSWLGEQLRLGQGTLSDYKRRYNLNIKTLSKYRCTISRGRILHERVGRPKSLDSQSQNAIQHFIIFNPDFDDHDLRSIIRMEHMNTMHRRFLVNEGESEKVFKPLSWRSVTRYVVHFKKIVASLG